MKIKTTGNIFNFLKEAIENSESTLYGGGYYRCSHPWQPSTFFPETITTQHLQEVIEIEESDAEKAYELVDNEDGGIVSFTLKGNHQETVYGCHNKASWKQVLKWFDDYEKEIIEGMTQAIKKESKKARF